jgi:hypothetical protein
MSGLRYVLYVPCPPSPLLYCCNYSSHPVKSYILRGQCGVERGGPEFPSYYKLLISTSPHNFSPWPVMRGRAPIHVCSIRAENSIKLRQTTPTQQNKLQRRRKVIHYVFPYSSSLTIYLKVES